MQFNEAAYKKGLDDIDKPLFSNESIAICTVSFDSLKCQNGQVSLTTRADNVNYGFDN